MTLYDYLSLGASLIAVIAFVILWRASKISEWFRSEPTRFYWAAVPESAFSLGLPILAAIFKPWEEVKTISGGIASGAPYIMSGPYISRPILIFTFVILFTLKVAIVLIKEDVKNLKLDLDKNTMQYGLLIKIEALITLVIKQKAARFQALLKWRRAEHKRTSMAKLREAMDPCAQIVDLVKALHSFFFADADDAQIRVAIYVVGDDESLVRTASWNGSSSDCFSKDTEILPLVSHPGRSQNRLSVVAEHYSAIQEKPLRIIPDTLAADQQGKFSFFGDESRKQRLKSMIVYRTMVPSANNDGERAVMIAIDSDQANRFTEDRREIYDKCLQELGKRFALEYLLDAVLR